MSLIELFKKYRDRYMRSALDTMEFPEFPPDEIVRYKIIFRGIVQGVGFRYEAWLIAGKLGLTGFAENLPDGSVRMEIQGQENKIQHLISCMESIRRISIEKKEITKLPLVQEDEFQPIY